jgi:hypothetical protein
VCSFGSGYILVCVVYTIIEAYMHSALPIQTTNIHVILAKQANTGNTGSWLFTLHPGPCMSTVVPLTGYIDTSTYRSCWLFYTPFRMAHIIWTLPPKVLWWWALRDSVTWWAMPERSKGWSPDRERYPGPPGWVLGMGLTTSSSKKNFCSET